jgi:hypothetical protein
VTFSNLWTGSGTCSLPGLRAAYGSGFPAARTGHVSLRFLPTGKLSLAPSAALAAIWVMRRMISCSSPGNARPRMSMSRATRRAPN